MVGRAAEQLLFDRKVAGREVATERVLDLPRAARAGVAVVHDAVGVRRPDHVEVDHPEDLPACALAQALDVALRAEETELLAAPEGEPQPVLRPHVEATGLAGDLEDGGAARAVVV